LFIRKIKPVEMTSVMIIYGHSAKLLARAMQSPEYPNPEQQLSALLELQ